MGLPGRWKMPGTLGVGLMVLVLGGCAGGSPQGRLIRETGAHRFNKVERITFTFNVDRYGHAPVKRTWTWLPHEGQVTRTIDGKSITYNRLAMNENLREVDGQFINDTFWLLPSLHLKWAGDDVAVTDEGEADMPIGLGKARRVVVTYPTEGGGYTPGDVYELFIDREGLLRAWHFRRGGAAEPSLTNTFERYVEAGPLLIATEHRNVDGSFRLYFTDVKVVD